MISIMAFQYFLGSFVISLLISSSTVAALADYTPPPATIIPIFPRGIHMSIPDEEGVSLVAFHVKFNEDFVGLEAGTIARDILKPVNGRWTYQDKTTKLKVGDIVYYWIHAVYEGQGFPKLDYNLIDQNYTVGELVPEGLVNPLSPPPGGSGITNPSGPWVGSSETKIVNEIGRYVEACRGQLLFEENFDNLSPSRWTVHEHFPEGPNYEFNVYLNNNENVRTESGQLRITPRNLAKGNNKNYIRDGTLTLNQCSKKFGNPSDCERQARGAYILPPFTSGKISTENSFRFLYGRVEIRAKLPKGDWIYPLLSLEPLNSPLAKDQRVSMRVASSSGNAVLRSFDGDDLSGYILRGGAVTPTLAKAGFAFSPDSNATGGELWSNDFHVYELIWQRDRITLKVDGNRYALGATPIVAANQPMFVNLALAVGGLREFPDRSRTDRYEKPWRNTGAKAVLSFYNAMDKYIGTWTERSKDLVVDYVKVYAL